MQHMIMDASRHTILYSELLQQFSILANYANRLGLPAVSFNEDYRLGV